MRRAKLGRIAAENAANAAKPKGSDIFANERAGFGAVLDKQSEMRTAGQRLDAERARPGKQVKHPGAGDRVGISMHQNIEQRFAQPVGGGPDGSRLRAGQRPPAQASADHAHQSMIPKSGYRFSEKIMLQNKIEPLIAIFALAFISRPVRRFTKPAPGRTTLTMMARFAAKAAILLARRFGWRRL